jgi:hypothetical protein
MKFDSRLVFAEPGPGKTRQTEVDGRGVESVNGLTQIDAKIVVGIQGSGDFDQHLSKVGIDFPGPVLVRVGQRAFGDLASDPHVIKFGVLGAQAYFDIAETLPIGELSKGHTQKLIEAGKISDSMIALILLNAFSKFM